MAKAKTGINKSAVIREAFEEFPNATAKEIVAHLKAKGVEVAEGLVYQVKKTSKNKKPSKKPAQAQKAKAKVAATAKAAVPSSNGVLSVAASISLVKATAAKVGGWTALREIVDALK